MALIDDDEIEMRRRKETKPLRTSRVVDGIQHRRICRKNNPRIPVVLILTQIAQRMMRQIPLEIILRLPDQRRPIRQKQNIRHPFAAREHIDETRRRARLSRACRHHQQMLADTPLRLGAHRANRFLLVVPIRDPVINRNRIERRHLLPAPHEPLQILLGKETAHPPLRCRPVIPEKRLEPIRRKDHRATAVFPLQTIRV